MLRLLSLFLIAVPAWAAEPEAPGLSSGNFLQAVLALGLIIALLLGTAWLARKVTGGKGFGQGGMAVIGGIALSPRERIVLVEVGDTWLVVGIVPGQIRTLHRMPKGDVPAVGLNGSDASFTHWLKTVAERRRDA